MLEQNYSTSTFQFKHVLNSLFLSEKLFCVLNVPGCTNVVLTFVSAHLKIHIFGGRPNHFVLKNTFLTVLLSKFLQFLAVPTLCDPIIICFCSLLKYYTYVTLPMREAIIVAHYDQSFCFYNTVTRMLDLNVILLCGMWLGMWNVARNVVMSLMEFNLKSHATLWDCKKSHIEIHS